MNLPDRYTSTGVSTSGGMGDISVCLDTHLSRKVIIKTLKSGQDDRRLIDERKALLKLRSKHVVQLFDLVESNDASPQKALVLEFIEGKDLGPAEYSSGIDHLNVIWQISCGLLAIHNEQIIHRDIKPNNVRIDNDGVVKILDFGLARSVGKDANTRSAIGTPGFMAPELWKSTNVSFDQSIDVYAFAATALSLVHNDLPDELENWPPLPIARGALKPLLPNTPSDVVNLLEACLNRLPQDRPSIAIIETTIRKHLLKGRHRALLTLGSSTHEINAKSRSATVTSGTRGSIGIKYDGLIFTVTSSSGSVTINNAPFSLGDELPACCVITFGNQNPRSFVTFDVSNPEVMS
ncbi:serine/threonine-protein kinase [Janthinobacterium psychrotolerans]|uniref:Serine/threonine protein kinase n=1 Tax=Janthinobacterium psychrotolerans TaxID=1747903 RepID=A0A1A7CBC1_9BURK|nr:serine/threonine-protein kinase [Janthinobacterium psychrotolerans]OBV41603.1 Serine/threonine protein kinase [Janthinobacterium psychrotolerans]